MHKILFYYIFSQYTFHSTFTIFLWNIYLLTLINNGLYLIILNISQKSLNHGFLL